MVLRSYRIECANLFLTHVPYLRHIILYIRLSCLTQGIELKITALKILGAASIFEQGGSLRLVIPKKILRYLNVTLDPDDQDENATVILIVTDRGILIRPLSDLLRDDEMKNL